MASIRKVKIFSHNTANGHFGIMSYSGDRMYGELEGNLITLHNDYPGEEEDEVTYSTTKYKITDDLQFVQLINN